MRKIFLILLLWVAVSASATQEVADIWQHFLGGVDEPRSGVLRLDLDMTGDNVPEIFLSDSSLWEKSARTWMVYSPVGNRFLFLGTIRFHDKLVRFDPSQGLVTAWETAGIGRYRKVDYRLSESGIETLRTQNIDEEADRESVDEVNAVLQNIDGHRAALGFKVAAASIEEAKKGLQGSDVLWRDMRSGAAVQGLRRIIGSTSQGVTKGASAATTIFEHFNTQRVLGPQEHVYMLQFDATGDGVSEIFLNNEAWHPTLEWLIYSSEGDGYRFLGGLAFDPSRIRYDEEAEALILLRRSPKVIESFKIGPEGIRSQKVVDWSRNWAGVGAPELQKIKEWGAAVGLEPLEGSLPDLISGAPSAPWRRLGTEEIVSPAVDTKKKLISSGS